MINVCMILAAIALVIALCAFQSVQNWEKQKRDEQRHLELRIDNLMEIVRQLSKELSK